MAGFQLSKSAAAQEIRLLNKQSRVVMAKLEYHCFMGKNILLLYFVGFFPQNVTRGCIPYSGRALTLTASPSPFFRDRHSTRTGFEPVREIPSDFESDSLTTRTPRQRGDSST
jgi:hypothetical protein